ncbi:MAG: helix-turn-helix domain-containing protein [Ruminococcaceae bacterium]|nr:helix-turn-helix domain-containing protein [Oscillospiraceae bacterium]
MKQYFAGNLKKLRKNADITQEKLAECLGVLPQTVSKWERAETYPDIETLPSLANFFGITIDELLGNDQLRTEEIIDQMIADIRETARQGNEERAVEMARAGYKRYPSSYKMMDYLCTVLQSYDVTDANWNERKTEIRRVAERILEGCTVEEYRYGAIESLCMVCEPEEREEMYKKIPSGFSFIRELWMKDLLPADTEEGLELRQKNIIELMWHFLNEVTELCGRWYPRGEHDPQCDIDTWIGVCEMKLAIYRCLFRDGDYLDFAWNAASAYSCLAEAYMSKGDGEAALDCWEKTAEFSEMNESVPPYAKHTSYLVNRLVYDEAKLGKFGSCGSPEDYLHRMKQPLYDPIREDARFREVMHRFETGPRNLRKRDEKDFEWVK